jgi:hypothetical protein
LLNKVARKERIDVVTVKGKEPKTNTTLLNTKEALLGQLNSIKVTTLTLYNTLCSGRHFFAKSWTEWIKGIVKDYDNARKDFLRLVGNFLNPVELDNEICELDMMDARVHSHYVSVLRSIDAEISKGIGALQSPIESEKWDKLNSLRKEMAKLSAKLGNSDFKRNINEAIKECEQNHFLPSAMISGRVIMYTMQNIQGKNYEEKTEFLMAKNVIEKNRKELSDRLLRSAKLARDRFAHDISVFAESTDAVVLIGDAIEILKLYSKL